MGDKMSGQLNFSFFFFRVHLYSNDMKKEEKKNTGSTRYFIIHDLLVNELRMCALYLNV